MDKSAIGTDRLRGLNHFVVGLFILGLFSLIPLFWFRGDHLIGGGDHSSAINYVRLLKSLDSSWSNDLNTGRLENYLMTHVPYSLIYIPLDQIGVSVLLQEKVWFILSLLVPGFFMYCFLWRFLGDKIPFPVRVVSALFYMFNPFVMIQPIALNFTKAAVYLSLPILAYLLVSVFESPKWSKKIMFGVFFALTSTLTSGAFLNVAETAPLFIVLSLLFAYELLTHDDKLKHLLLFVAILLLSFLLNFWWIYSSFLNMFASRKTILEALGGFKAVKTKMFDAMRLFGFWALNSKNLNVPYYTFGNFYYSPMGVFITYSITLVVLFPLFYIALFGEAMTKVMRGKVLFLLFLLFFGIFWVKGETEPLGFLFAALWDSVGLFRVFREPFAKFSLISLFSFTALMCVSLYFIVRLIKTVNLPEKITRWSSLIISVAFFGLIVLVSFPMFNGQTVRDWTYGSMKGQLVKVPEYWLDLTQEVGGNLTEGRVLTLPKSTYYKKSFIWERGFVGRPADLFLDAETTFYFESPLNKGDALMSTLYDTIERNSVEPSNVRISKIINLMRILNIGYVLQMNDLDWLSLADYENWEPEKIQFFYDGVGDVLETPVSFGLLSEEYLLTIPHVIGGEKIHRFEGDPTAEDYLNAYSGRDALLFYAVSDDYLLPRIYIPDMIDSAFSVEEFMTKLSSLDDFETKPMYVAEDDISFEPSEPPESLILDYQKQSSSRYVITLPGTLSGVVPIVFSETYDPGWMLAKNCGWFRCGEIVEAQHFEVNQYANGWLVDTSKVDTKEMYIVHSSEFRLKLGLVVSLTTLTFSILALVFIGYRINKQSKLRKSIR